MPTFRAKKCKDKPMGKMFAMTECVQLRVKRVQNQKFTEGLGHLRKGL